MIHVWDLHSGTRKHTLAAPPKSWYMGIQFSPDGTLLLACRYGDHEAGLTIALGALPARSPAACWDIRAEADAGSAYQAIAHLAATPRVAVPCLAKQLKPVPREEVQEIHRSIATLDNDDFAVRDAAFRRLNVLGPSAAPLLRQAVAKNDLLEKRRRIEQFLDSPGSWPWCATVLERAGTPEARRLLETLAGGGAGAWLTLEAQAACARRR